MTDLEKYLNQVKARVEHARRPDAIVLCPTTWREAYTVDVERLVAIVELSMERIDDLRTHGPRQRAVANLALSELDRLATGEAP